jgi:hypothetical protein
LEIVISPISNGRETIYRIIDTELILWWLYACLWDSIDFSIFWYFLVNEFIDWIYWLNLLNKSNESGHCWAYTIYELNFQLFAESNNLKIH